ncbi:MAG: tRNA 2-selenouridine(34) synthase MnmH [Pseudomonadota bacterium]|nr:tRNA 2-selenouridine(34) synthase MnmH [Pseudomonadota bacterium]
MSPPITRTKDWLDRPYSMIIDVRSESEFLDDHIPGAVSMPVLNDRERAEIGTIYKQIGAFEAKRRGAALVARNIAAHIESKLLDVPKDFSPLVYCWRGGQRSGAMGRILSEIGWKVTLVDGGYKTYRKAVLNGLDEVPPRLRPIILRGRTGTAKTRILRAAMDAGAQVIDLEGLANHRGSLLGPEPGVAQPSQRQFESRLFAVLGSLDPERPVFIEAESNKIGDIHIPPVLWKCMRGAPALQVVVPLEARVKFLMSDYAHIVAEPALLKPLMSWVVTRIGHERVDEWRSCIESGDWTGFVSRVLEDHYDPAYDRSGATRGHDDLGELTADNLDDAAIASLAGRLAAWQ